MSKVLLGAGGLTFSSGEAKSNPPNPSGAMGPDAYVASVNWKIGLYSPFFVRQAIVSGRDFFGHGGDQSDAKVLYADGHYWIAAITPGGLSVARSKTWNTSLDRSRWDFILVPSAGLDYPMITPAGTGIVVAFSYPWDKYLLVRPDLGCMWQDIPQSAQWTGPRMPVGEWLMQHAISPSRLRFYNLVSQKTTDVPVPEVSTYGRWPTQPGGKPIPPPQPQSAAMTNGREIVFAMSYGGAIYWFVLDNELKLLQQGKVSGDLGDCYMPAIGINDKGDIGLCYLYSSPTQYLGMWVRGRTPADPLGTMSSPVLVKESTVAAKMQNRSGDLAWMSVDAATGRFQATSQFATDVDANANRDINWSTYAQEFYLSQNEPAPSITGELKIGSDVYDFTAKKR